jgi:hypothetical protein
MAVMEAAGRNGKKWADLGYIQRFSELSDGLHVLMDRIVRNDNLNLGLEHPGEW